MIEKCAGCGGKKVQMGLDGIKVLCPVCKGSGVMHAVTTTRQSPWDDRPRPYDLGYRPEINAP